MFSIPLAYRKWAMISAVVICLIAILILWHQLSSPVNDPTVYYYDLNTGKTFNHVFMAELPIAAPSGPAPDGKPAGVRAWVYSCGACNDESKRVLVYLESRSGTSPDSQKVYSRPGKIEWFDQNSPAYSKAIGETKTMCGDTVPDECLPE